MNDEHEHTEPTEGGARRSIPVPESVIAELRRLRAEADTRFARTSGGAMDAPLVLLYDEAHGAFELPVDPAARAAVAEAMHFGSRVRLRTVTAAVPEGEPVLGKVRAAAAADAMRMRIEREHAEAEARRREEQRAARRREIAESVTAAETAWHNLFTPDAEAPELAWKGYPSTRDEPGGHGPLAVAHLGQGVFVHAEPGGPRDRRCAVSVLAPCACAPNRYRCDPVRSGAQLSRVLDQILGETPECADTCVPGSGQDGGW